MINLLYISWILQAVLCLPFAYLLKYIANDYDHNASAKALKGEPSRIIRFSGMHEGFTVIFFVFLFFWSVVNAITLKSSSMVGGTASESLIIFQCIGAILTCLNAPNLFFLSYYKFKNFKKNKDKKDLLAGLVEIHLAIILSLLACIWSIGALTSTSGHLLTGFDTSKFVIPALYIITALCFSLIIICGIITFSRMKNRYILKKDNTSNLYFWTYSFSTIGLLLILICFSMITLSTGYCIQHNVL